jgi:hypothetical protein
MKIKIWDQDFRLTLVLPTSLLYCRLTGKILAMIFEKAFPNTPLSRKEIRKLQTAIQTVKKEYRHLELISVESKNSIVKIML